MRRPTGSELRWLWDPALRGHQRREIKSASHHSFSIVPMVKKSCTSYRIPSFSYAFANVSTKYAAISFCTPNPTNLGNTGGKYGRAFPVTMNTLGVSESFKLNERKPSRAFCAATNIPAPIAVSRRNNSTGSDKGSAASFGGLNDAAIFVFSDRTERGP